MMDGETSSMCHAAVGLGNDTAAGILQNAENSALTMMTFLGGENKKINKIKKRAELHFSFVIKIRINPVKFKLIQLNHLSFLISLL